MNLFTVIGLSLVGASAAVLVKNQHKDIALLISAGFSVALLLFAFTPLREIVKGIDEVAEKYSIDAGSVKIILKIIGVSYLVRFAADLCKDSGEIAIASKVELFGKLAIGVMVVPVVLEILDRVSDLMGV